MAFGNDGFPAMWRLHSEAAPPRSVRGGAKLIYWSSLMVSISVHSGVVLYALTHTLLPTPQPSIVAMPPVSIEVVSVQAPRTPEQHPAEPVAATTSARAGGSAPEKEAAQPQSDTADDEAAPAGATPVASHDAVLQLDAGETVRAKSSLTPGPVMPRVETPPEPAFEHEPERDMGSRVIQPVGDGRGPSLPRTEERQPAPALSSSDESGPVSEERKPLPAAGGAQSAGATTASVAPVRVRQFERSARHSANRAHARAYRRKVVAHLTANKPNGGMGRGTVRIAFALSRSGRLLALRVYRSSGRSDLDRAALASVRRASPFPRPPSSLKGARHRFVVPFYFR